MKRHLHSLLQHSRSRFKGTRAAHRATAPRNMAASASLQPQDGYDWLRQIKQVQRVGRTAGR
ncbi:hypothetical protein ASG75_03515 [Rhodanobacter sp. Soil772]|nr:hypothetical protein ASG75_03515 [Rhodanobacter sp. Soil772]